MFENLEAGKQVLDRFNFWVGKLFMKNYSYDEFARASNFKDTAIYLSGIGDQFVISGVWDFTMDSLMEKLARASAGKIPLKMSFDAVFRDQATSTFSFVGVQNDTSNPIVYVGAGIADSILNGAATIGNGVIDTGEGAIKAVVNSANLLKYALPVLVVGAIGLYFYLNVKSAPKIPGS